MTMNSGFSEPSPQQPTTTALPDTAHAGRVVDDVPIPPNDINEPRPSPTPSLPIPMPSLARRTMSAIGGNRNNNNNIMSPPPLLKRRAFSYDAPRNSGDAPSSLRSDAVAAARSDSSRGFNSDMLSLRTIPSQVEMDDTDNDDNDQEIRLYQKKHDSVEDDYYLRQRRTTLFYTPTRTRGGVDVGQQQQLFHHESYIQNDDNRHRSRAASSSGVVLNIDNNDSCPLLPCYDDDSACRIATAGSSNDAEQQQEMEPEQQHGGGSFTTPKRRISRPSAFNNRERANTCPHRPQRHSIFQLQQQHGEVGDEESGHQHELDGQLSDLEMERASSSPGSWIAQNNLNRVPSYMSSSARTLTPGDSPGRGRHTSPAVRRILSALPIPTFNTPLSARRTSSTTSVVGSPGSPQMNNASSSSSSSISGSIRGTPSSGHPAPASSPATVSPMTATQQAHNQAQNFLLRLNPHVMKLLMILSLYMLLAYTWNTDYQLRYKSMEINYGLSEYWHTGGSLVSQRRAEKIGRDVKGKLFNDDGDDGGIAKLINGLGDDKVLGDDKLLVDDATSSSGDSADVVGIVSPSGILSSIDKAMKRRPSMSHARSILTDTSHPAYGVQQRRATRANKPPSSKKWTISKLAWALVWMGFMIPIVEAAVREVRRQLNFRFWNVRRLRSFRAVPSSRVVNVHNL